jgi:cobalt-zinc-cadmium efflux system membrane fusion protein
MHIKKITLIQLFFLSALWLSCNKNANNKLSIIPADTIDAEKPIKLTDEQMKLAGIKTCHAESLFSNIIICDGAIEVPHENIEFIIAPLGGFVKYCPWQPGDFIKKDQTIIVLEHPDYVKIQQDYLETKSQWEYYKEEFKRQGELAVENATSIKIMQQAQANFRTTEVKLISLKNQLEFLGINSDTLNVENITQTIKIESPISGFISEINAFKGKYADANQPLVKIVNKSTLNLGLWIHKKYIHLIKVGEKIEFSLNNDSIKYKAVLKKISPMIDGNNNNYKVIAQIIKSEPFFIIDMPVKAYINCNKQTGFFIPLSSVIYDNNQPVVFIKFQDSFKRIILKNSIIINENIEVTNLPPEFSSHELVMNGAFYLNTIWHKL